MKAIIFDTETTGLMLPKVAPLEKQPRIIELGVITVVGGQLGEMHNWLINPGQEISAEITKITGIKNEDLVGKPSFSELLPELINIFSGASLLIAHNAPFDVGMLRNELLRAGCEDFPWPEDVVCTVQEYKHMFGRRAKLTELYERVVGKPLAQTHRANEDAYAVYEVLAADNFFKKITGEA